MTYEDIFHKVDQLQTEVSEANKILTADQIATIIKIVESHNYHPTIVKRMNLSIALYAGTLIVEIACLILTIVILRHVI